MNGNLPSLHPSEAFLSDEDVDVLKRTMLYGYTEAEQESFIRLAQRTQLDPFSKQLYATRRYAKDRSGNKVLTLVPVTSVLGLTAVAARTGHYDGCVITWCGTDGIWKDEWVSEEFPVAAKCVVYHKQRSHPEVAICRWNGYCGTSYNPATKRREVTEFWERLPDFMLGKCAKAAALRGAFPDQCGNLYASEELQGGISEVDELDDERKIAQNRKKEEELLKAAAAKGIKVVESKPTPKPTPAEAAAPAPDLPAPKGQGPEPTIPDPVEPPVAAESAQEPPDELEMGITEAPQPAAEPAAWKEHVIQGLRAAKFLGRKVGDLNPVELAAIAEQWIPKVKAALARGEMVKQAQQDDAKAIEAAIEHSKMEKPWS